MDRVVVLFGEGRFPIMLYHINHLLYWRQEITSAASYSTFSLPPRRDFALQ